jgi:hypothetical protein
MTYVDNDMTSAAVSAYIFILLIGNWARNPTTVGLGDATGRKYANNEL